MIRLVIATRNRHKVQEIQAILGPTVTCQSLDDFPGAPAPVEDAATFAGNATQKARRLAAWLAQSPAAADLAAAHAWILADDSGLEVDALHGAPGVRSARFATGDAEGVGNAPDAANNAKLLRLLAGVPFEQRTARFRCVLALVQLPKARDQRPDRPPREETPLFEGACEGHIASAPRGNNGFGYDPLFYFPEFGKTTAELDMMTKGRISHRGKALRKMIAWLRDHHATIVSAE
jgi:XTP/dITP diphosphohydrolase